MKYRYENVIPYVLTSEPLQGCTVEEIRNTLDNDNSEETLALTYALVSQKAGWIEDDLYDEPPIPGIEQRYQQWADLKKDLLERIFETLKSEDVEAYKRLVEDNMGFQHVITPFMNRNGFRDACGWWIK